MSLEPTDAAVDIIFSGVCIDIYLYSFCPRASWLTVSNPEAEQLFSMVAEVFIFWAKSHVRTTDTLSLTFSTTGPRGVTVSPVFVVTEFQMGGTELRGTK